MSRPFKELADEASAKWDAATWELYDAACDYFKDVTTHD